MRLVKAFFLSRAGMIESRDQLKYIIEQVHSHSIAKCECMLKAKSQ